MRYLLFATAGTVLFFAVYWFFMRKETRFQMVRWYLLGTLALAMLLPLVRISVTTAVSREVVSAEEVEPLPQQNQVEAASVEATPSEEVVGAQPQAAPAVPYQVQEPKANQLTNWVEKGLVVVYLLGVAVMLIVLLVRLVDICLKLRSLRAHFTKEDRVALLEGDTPAFSFLNYIVVGRNGFSDEEVAQLVGHEKVHVRQHHTIDILFAEVVKVVLWFDPFVWLYARELKRVHEYIADSEMLAAPDGAEYAALFYHQVSGSRYSVIGNNFDYQITKKRIAMMTQKQSRFGSFKPLWVLPIAALLLSANCQHQRGISGTYEVSTITLRSDNPEEPDVKCGEFFDIENYLFKFKHDGTVKVVCNPNKVRNFEGTYIWKNEVFCIYNAEGKKWLDLDSRLLHYEKDSLAFQFIDPSPVEGMRKMLNICQADKLNIHKYLGRRIVTSGEDTVENRRGMLRDTVWPHISVYYDSYEEAVDDGWCYNNRLLQAITNILGSGVTTIQGNQEVFFASFICENNALMDGAEVRYDTLGYPNKRMDGDKFILQLELKKK